MKRILITGKNSYIGQRFAQFLLEQPEEYSVSFLSLQNRNWYQTDLSQYDVIVHTAGLVHRKETAENAALYYEVNRDLTVRLAKKAKSEGVKQFLFLSTGSVYGKLEGIITKDTKPQPNTSYGKSKLEAEEALIRMDGDGFAVAILRPLMVYGPGCKGNYQFLVKLAKVAPLLPDYKNRRSLVSIDTLCLCLREIIFSRGHGLYFPHDMEDVCTCEMIQQIAREQGRKLRCTRLLNPVVGLLRICTSAGKKAFGNLTYQDLDRLPLDKWVK